MVGYSDLVKKMKYYVYMGTSGRYTFQWYFSVSSCMAASCNADKEKLKLKYNVVTSIATHLLHVSSYTCSV